MNEDILIVVNDFEEQKKVLLSSALEAFQLQKLSATHLVPSKKLASILAEHNPKVLVMDYFLAEAGTAVDILETLEDVSNVIIWSDECSLDIAVSAMRLGISDYISMKDGSSIDKLVHRTFDLLNRKNNLNSYSLPLAKCSKEEYILDAPRTLECYQLAQSLGRQDTSRIIIFGPGGSGRNTFARIIHESQEKFGALIEIDMDLSSIDLKRELDELSKSSSYYGPRASLMLDHIEFNSDYLLETLKNFPLKKDASRLILGTSCKATAEACVRILNIPLLELPNLQQRKEDLPTFIRKSANSSLPKSIKVSEIVEWILEENWPGSVRQLKACLHEAYMSTKMDSSEHFMTCLSESKQRWERYNTVTVDIPSPAKALRTYLDSNRNMVTTAAKLGTGVEQVREALEQL